MTHTFSDSPKQGVCNPSVLSDSFFDDALRFYRSQPQVSPAGLGEIWSGVYSQCYGELLEVLEKGDSGSLRRVLEKLFYGNLIFGVDYNHDNDPAAYQEFWDETAIACAIQMGVLPEINPHQPSRIEMTRNELVAKMEGECGIGLRVSIGPRGLFGFDCGNSIVHPKMMEAASVLCGIRRYFDSPVESVIELGAGMGWLALAAWSLNAAIHYYIVDLPPMAVIQSYFLASTVSEESLSFGPWLSNFNILGMHWPYFHPDLIVNQDGLPEMPEPYRSRHLDEIGSRVKSGSLFLSINHESPLANQKRVYESARNGSDLRLRLRAPFRSRPGYMMEMFWK